MKGVIAGSQDIDLRVATASDDVLRSHSDSVNKLRMMLTSGLAQGVSSPAVEVSSGAACECSRSIVDNAANSLVLSTEVSHSTSDASCRDLPELEVFGAHSRELIFILPSDLNHITSITFCFSDTSASVSVIDSEVMVIALIDNNQEFSFR